MAVIVSPAEGLESPRWSALFRAGLTIAGVVLVVYFAIRVSRNAVRDIGGDWGVYYHAGQDFLAHEPLYTLEWGPYLTFKYAPVVAMCSAPLAVLPPVVARLLWFAGDVALVALLLRCVLALLPPPVGRISRSWLAVLATALALRYVMNQWHAGSTATLWVTLCVAACLLLREGRPKLAGFLLATAVMWKLVPICFLPLLALDHRRASAVGSFVASLVALAIAPAVWLGWEANLVLLQAWPEHLFATEIPNQVWRIQNQSIYAQLARFLAEAPFGLNVAELSLPAVQRIWLAVSLVSAAGLYAWIIAVRRSRPAGTTDGAVVAALLIFMTIYNPLAWRYNFIALVVPYLVVLDGAAARPQRRRWLIGLVVAAWLLGSVPAESSGLPGIVALHALGARMWGTVLLGLAVMLSIAPRAMAEPVDQIIGPLRVPGRVDRRRPLAAPTAEPLTALTVEPVAEVSAG